MTSNRVAFIAAPYGFGPSSKAIAIASHIPSAIGREYLGGGPPLGLARASGAFSNCVKLNFNTPADIVAEYLSRYSILVFVNSTRFISAASRFRGSIVFVDTLAWLRDGRPQNLPEHIPYFAQRFFEHGFAPELASTPLFCQTGAIVPKSFGDLKTKNNEPENSPLVHCGGLCSPAMRPGSDTVFVSHLLSSLDQTGLSMRIILPSHMHRDFATITTKRLSIVECSPIDVRDHIEGSSFILTTSGIEFTYECLLLGVPTLYLPPFNASQLLQLEYYRNHIFGCIQFDTECPVRRPNEGSLDSATADIQEDGMRGRWRHQFNSVSAFLAESNGRVLLDALPVIEQQQKEAVSRVGSAGATTIAEHIVETLDRPDISHAPT